MTVVVARVVLPFDYDRWVCAVFGTSSSVVLEFHFLAAGIDFLDNAAHLGGSFLRRGRRRGWLD